MTAWGGDCPLRPTPIPLSRPSPLPGMAVRKGTTYRQWDNNLDRDEIGQLLMQMRRKGFSPEYQAKILVHLGLLLDSVQNNVIRELRALKMLPQRPGPKPIFVKSEDWLREVLGKLESVEGWM